MQVLRRTFRVWLAMLLPTLRTPSRKPGGDARAIRDTGYIAPKSYEEHVMITQTASAVGLVLLAAGVLADRPSSFAESRGYQNCLRAAEREVKLLHAESRYFINEVQEDGARLYYLNAYVRSNGSANSDGRSDSARIACQTTMSGHRVLSVSVDDGRFAPIGSSSSEFASN